MEDFKLDDDPEKKGTSSKRGKKRAKGIGAFAVGPKRPEVPAETADDIWHKLSLTRRRAGKSEAPVPLTVMESGRAEPASGAEVSEAEVPLETLSAEERQYVAKEIVSEARRRAAADAAETRDAPEDVEYVPEAVPEAVAAFRGKIADDGLDAEQAFVETLRDLGIDARPAEGRSEVADDGETDVAPPAEAVNVRQRSMSSEPSPSFTAQSAPIFSESGPERPAQISTAASTGDKYPKHGLPTWLTVTLPPRHSPRVREAKNAVRNQIPRYNNGDMRSAALTGGIVGYLIGRRRGRIRTERKLLPAQKKLEKQVRDLREDIQHKEVYIRKMVRQRRKDSQKLSDMERDRPDIPDETSRQIAMEANQLHGKKVAPERIGRVLMVAEDRPTATPKAEKPEKPTGQQPTGKRVETMSRAELLELSEKINVENTNLRHIYETHLVGEQGLRRLISEYARGGNVQKVLRQELLEHEIDFERDPVLRDRAQTSGGAASSETLSQLLKKAEILTDREAKEELTILKARQAHQESRHVYHQQRRRVLDISMVTAILVLFVLVVTLLVTTR